MFDNLDLTTTIVAMLGLMAGSTVLGTLGFGLAIAAAPLLLLVLDVQSVVVILNVAPILIYVLIIARTWRVIPFGQIVPVVAAGLVGAPIGVLALSFVPENLLRITISLLILALTACVVFRVQIPYGRSEKTLIPVGFSVGALVIATGMGGPILALMMLYKVWSAEMLRGSLALFFLLIMATGALGYGVAGLYTAERVGLILLVIVPVLFGFRLSNLIVGRLDERRFRHGVIAFITVSSLVVLGREMFVWPVD